MEFLFDRLLPQTDAEVFAQLALVLVVFGVALRRFWGRPDLRLVVIGGGLMALALIGVRALH
jgi:hypothetical protein